MTKYLIGVSLAAVLLAGSAAQAIPVPVPWTTEDFNSYPDGTHLYDVPGWDGGGLELFIKPFNPTNGGLYPEYTEPAPYMSVRMRGVNNSNTTGYSHAWNGDYGWTQQSAGVIGIVTFDLQAQLGSLDPNNNDHFVIQISDHNDNSIGSLNGSSSEVKFKDASGAILSAISIADGARYNYSFILDPTTGEVEYLLNGSVVGSYNVGSGRNLGWIYIKDFETAGATRDIVRFDNLVAGTVPEPTALVLLGLGGLMALRRRQA